MNFRPNTAWFDPRDSGHWLWLVIGLVLGAIALFGVNDIRESREHGPVVRVVEVAQPLDRINLGSPYTIDLVVKKLRVDCDNGRSVRHMVEVNTGVHYEVAREEILQLPLGLHPFSVTIPTHPLAPSLEDLHKPGLWKITSRITYDCPDGPNGEDVPRSFVFETPPFTVLE